MSSFEIKQKDILVTYTNRTRARKKASSMAGSAQFPRSRLLPLLSLSIKLVCVKKMLSLNPAGPHAQQSSNRQEPAAGRLPV
jgi:hypothetical protein